MAAVAGLQHHHRGRHLDVRTPFEFFRYYGKI
nr:MAG TPA: hypothetical protein [Bacteriophage sp.]DAZ74796.1 MAG TPA: hypothetical protein [Caudoviricetes sp.]